jgi:hypothetical protein
VGAAAALGVAVPDAAHAATGGWSGSLYPGAPRQCVGATARSLAKVSGSASATGARFVVLRDGVQLVDTGASTNFYAGTFTGSGFYQFCARNPQGTPGPVYASIGLRTDNDAS